METKSLKLSQNSVILGYALCKRWQRAGCNHTLQMCMGQVAPIAFPSHQPQSVPSDQRPRVLNIREECDAAYSRDLGYEGGYTEPSLA